MPNNMLRTWESDVSSIEKLNAMKKQRGLEIAELTLAEIALCSENPFTVNYTLL